MADVFTILSLPKTSKAFSALPAVGISEREGSASPLRKVPRLDRDSDSASASRSRAVAADAGGRVAIKVLGIPIKPSTGSPGDKDFALVTRSVRVLLDKQSRDGLPVAYEYIYRACRSAVDVYNRGEGLYENVKLELEKCIGSLAKELLQDRSGDVEWLLSFNETCAWFDKQTAILQSVLTYLDRVYIVHKKNTPSIKRLVSNLFAERIFENSSIVERLHTGIRTWIEWERKERAPHKLREHIPALVRHLSSHNQYLPIFESFLLDITKPYYEAESAERAEVLRGDARDFLKHCEARRKEEEQRAKAVLPESSCQEIVHTTDKALLTGRLDWLAKDALSRLMNDKAAQRLAVMYQLFARVAGQKVLCAAFKLHVQNTVKGIVKDKERDEEMVQRLLDFKAFCDKLCADAFVNIVKEGFTDTSKLAASPAKAGSSSKAAVPTTRKDLNKDFSYAVIDAFALGFKARRNKPAEMVAKYIDRAMRKGQKGKRDEEFQAELDAALGLYRFTDDKDVFRTFYHRALAKRLLLERSASDDFEKAMLKKLKERYDPEFGMGDHMFNDLALSRDLMREYNGQRTRLGYGEATQKLSVMVLQRSFWPFAARQYDVDIPPAMQDELTKYTAFYKNKHSGRKLDWDHTLGTATLKARFNSGDKELSVSLYQGIVLLLFNESAELSFKDIKEQTRMDDAELRRTLQSLALGKKRVLRKVPVGKEVGDGDDFHYNADFSDPRYQVHINSIQVKETAEENKRTQTAIEGDRKHALDAAIVRVMKARKELHYEQLKAATIDAVKNHFVPEVSVIKQRIASLVEQEYLRRDEDDMNMYIYVA